MFHRRRLVRTAQFPACEQTLRPGDTEGVRLRKDFRHGRRLVSVDVKKSQDLMTLRFLIDDTTKIDGKLDAGCVATVDYCTNDGNTIAAYIVVQSTVRSYQS